MSSMTPEQIQQLQFNARNQLQSLSPCLSCDQAPQLDDIEMLAVVGSGSFGKVYLVQDDEEELLAMKVIKKKTVERPDHCTSERRVLASVRFPFIVEYKYHFQTFSHLYLLTEYVDGTDLLSLLTYYKYFDNDCTKFYLVEVLVTLEYLHSLGIVYRDLKLENILVAHDGHIKIVDFGFSKKMMTGQTLCGTPEYLAPEIFRGEAYDKGVDWWAFGVLAYELRTGCTPYHSNSKDSNQRALEVQQKIEAKEEVTFSRGHDPDFTDMVTKLLEYNPKERLGNVDRVRCHMWFRDVDFNRVVRKQLKPPVRPVDINLLRENNLEDVKDDDEAFKGFKEVNNNTLSDEFKDF